KPPPHDQARCDPNQSEEGITDEVREVLVPAAGQEQRARRRSDLLRRCIWQTGKNATQEEKHNEKWNSARGHQVFHRGSFARLCSRRMINPPMAATPNRAALNPQKLTKATSA